MGLVEHGAVEGSGAELSAHVVGFDEGDRRARDQQVTGCGQAGDASTDDDDVAHSCGASSTMRSARAANTARWSLSTLDRTSVVEGKRVSVRVDLGGSRKLKKKQ